jgi:hypothetical protein
MIVLTFYAAILAILLARHALFLRCERALRAVSARPLIRLWGRTVSKPCFYRLMACFHVRSC